MGGHSPATACSAVPGVVSSLAGLPLLAVSPVRCLPLALCSPPVRGVRRDSAPSESSSLCFLVCRCLAPWPEFALFSRPRSGAAFRPHFVKCPVETDCCSVLVSFRLWIFLPPPRWQMFPLQWLLGCPRPAAFAVRPLLHFAAPFWRPNVAPKTVPLLGPPVGFCSGEPRMGADFRPRFWAAFWRNFLARRSRVFAPARTGMSPLGRFRVSPFTRRLRP